MVLDFKKPTIDDMVWFNDTLKDSKELGFEYAFGSILIWAKTLELEMCKYKDFIFVIRNKEDDPSYFICGKGDLKEAIEVLKKHAKEVKGTKLILRGITKEQREEIEKFMPDRFVFEDARDDWNYIYNVKELAELKGKKFRNKRNHVYKFNKLYEYECCDITSENMGECISLSNKWFEKNDIESRDMMSDKVALNESFKNYDALKFKGIMIKVNNVPVAFTIGEPINNRIFVTHFEKALVEYEGSYNVVNQEFAKVLLNEGYELVNREEDLGLEGLRKAKLSYRPEILLEKYIACSKE